MKAIIGGIVAMPFMVTASHALLRRLMPDRATPAAPFRHRARLNLPAEACHCIEMGELGRRVAQTLGFCGVSGIEPQNEDGRSYILNKS